MSMDLPGGGAAAGKSADGGGGGGGGGGSGGHIGMGAIGKAAMMVRRASLGNQPMQERWVCPNDRQLALRAKLKMGWSTSQPVPVTRQDSLTEAETKMILEVIKRAEQLEVTEQQRIGRLVDKVELMKGRAQGNGNNNCILCGESLPVLRANTFVCADCSKRVCSKCGVESISQSAEKLWLCKICAETREMWKRSGAWFFRGIPKHILPTCSSSAPNTATRRSRAPPRRAHTLAVKAGGGSSEMETDTSSEDEPLRRNRLHKTASESGAHDGEIPPLPSPNPRSRSVSPSPFRFDSSDSAGPGGVTRDSSDEHASDKSPMSPDKNDRKSLTKPRRSLEDTENPRKGRPYAKRGFTYGFP